MERRISWKVSLSFELGSRRVREDGEEGELTSTSVRFSVYFCRSGYIDEVSLALQFVRESPEATLEEKKKFFKSANKVRSKPTAASSTRRTELTLFLRSTPLRTLVLPPSVSVVERPSDITTPESFSLS